MSQVDYVNFTDGIEDELDNIVETPQGVDEYVQFFRRLPQHYKDEFVAETFHTGIFSDYESDSELREHFDKLFRVNILIALNGGYPKEALMDVEKMWENFKNNFGEAFDFWINKAHKTEESIREHFWNNYSKKMQMIN
jgi:hypothetical protein